ncbi:MAG: hypothetical protein P0Y53_21880 [Candidatus Pseudobacter hemicellulosilyticus]|uniref:Uncharacterized protein n=1 Tax=Candidatus Pseudobacter hemicellulosilyticus TaxID=3121375 RepID=A0AAJ6BFI6_9BACT|nr:MAG: hypothetical protein P0Y53_21880 [Pseudobacter sp.]
MKVLVLGSDNARSIILETSKGTRIDNYQVLEISNFERNQFIKYDKANFPMVIFRSSPSPEYNCHGLTFASRRTNIDNSIAIRLILSEDRYCEIGIREVLPGDVVLYVNKDDKEIVHSGIVSACEHPPNSFSHITIVSKWGRFREVIHDLNNCPYNSFQREFYRIKHEQYEQNN